MALTGRVLESLVLLFGGTLAASGQELTWASRMFDTRQHDFGVVARGADVSHRFKLTNPYNKPIHISDFRTTCGCSAAKPTKKRLAPGEVGYIEVTMDARRFVRRKDSTLIVAFDKPFFAEVRIPVTAFIRPDVIIEPDAASFGSVDYGIVSQRNVTISYKGRNDWSIRRLRVDNPHLEAKVVETSRRSGGVAYDLLVSLKPTAPPGELRSQIVLVTDDADNPNVAILVQANVESGMIVTPAPVLLGTLAPGKSKTVKVVLRGKKPFAIEKIECESPKRVVVASLSKAARRVHVVSITITAPQRTGKYQVVFQATIKGRPASVIFRAKGRVASAID